jgi:hypothetical protein
VRDGVRVFRRGGAGQCERDAGQPLDRWGRELERALTLIRDGASFFNDKNAITADPHDAHFIYAVWDRLANSGGGPSYFARSIDAGLSCEAARAIYTPVASSQTIGNRIVVLPDATLVNFFTQIDTAGGSASAHLDVIRSADKGVSWSAPTAASAGACRSASTATWG